MSTSPGGALLRASRVFALPKALKTPVPAGGAGASNFGSNTATLPHPIHQSITTPQSSQAKGDWGFKRALPLRSTTRTSTPYIRVKAIDTYEHITDYASASDHTMTLQKFQEMGLTLTAPERGSIYNSFMEKSIGKSVFEDELDTIAPADDGVVGQDDTRWKFKGPWLAGLTQGEFIDYVRKEVGKRRVEFQAFLRNRCAISYTDQAARSYAESGDEWAREPKAVNAADITSQQLNLYIKSLRSDTKILYSLIRQFLDLPPAPNKSLSSDFGSILEENFAAHNQVGMKSDDFAQESKSPYCESGPPKTHPSAGLAYGRTSSVLFNHPLFGPQQSQPPVQGRVVMPKGAATGKFPPMLGVGGFVTQVPGGESAIMFDRGTGNQGKIDGLMTVELKKVGGSKAWVKPTSAVINPRGEVIMKVRLADAEAVAVKMGTTESIPARPVGPTRNDKVKLPGDMRGGVQGRANTAALFGGGNRKFGEL